MHIKVTATSQPLLYYVTLVCTVIYIQAGTGRGGVEYRPPAVQSICVCVYLICA